TPAPDEVRPQNPEALARLIMEQLPQKKSSLVTMILGVFGGGGSKPKASKAAKAEKPTSIKGGGAIKEKASKFKGKDKVGDRDAEQDRRPGGVTFGRKKDEHIDNEAIESQVGTFSRLKSISNRTPEQLDREAQSTTRSLGEKFGMPGANTVLDEGPLTLAESIKRKVSESQKLSPLDDDPDASGSLVPIPDSSGMGASPYARAEAASGGESSWGPPSFASSGAKPGQIGMTPEAEKVDWGGGAQMAKAPAMPAFNPSTPVGFDEHPGSSIGLAPPGSKRPMTTEQPAESPKVGIGLAPSAGAGWGGSSSSSASTAGGGGGWGATDTSQASADGSNSWGGASTPAAPAASAAPAQAAPASGWTSGWGGEGAASAQVPLKSSDSWAVPGSESTNSWGQPAESQAVAEPASAPPAAQAPSADPWAPPSGSWGGGSTESGGNQAAAAQVPSSNDAWGAAVSGGATGASDPWGTPAAPTASKEANAPAAQPAASSNDAWGAAVNSPQPAVASSDPWGAAAAAPAAAESSFAPAPAATASGDAWGQPAAAPAPSGDAWGQPAAAPAPSG
ncbi:MAG: hypothetical protein JSS86_21860, partial [Cyanobacteria bacterium SZAS LIN-2]|nr:hypothetical protein [Cyanobacteria bacterium SZAS LIN-2]